MREHVNTTQRTNNAALELLTAQITAFTAGKQAELQEKVDEMLSTMQGQLHGSAKGLYDQALAEARSYVGSRSDDGG